MTIKKIPVILLLLLVDHGAKAQKNVTHQSLYWIRYYNQLSLNQKWTWHNEIDDRRFFENNTQHHLIVHSVCIIRFLKTSK